MSMTPKRDRKADRPLTRRAFAASAAALLATPAKTLGAAAPVGMRIKPDWEGMVPVPGGRAYVRVNGDLHGPKSPVVMLHGGPGSSHWYYLGATSLADERAVILYDQLDSGRSDTPGDPKNWMVPRFVEELKAIRRGLGVDRWHVLGGSWGATIALEYGAERPAALKGLILQSPLVSTPLWMKDAARLRSELPATAQTTLQHCDNTPAPPAAECDAAMAIYYDLHLRRTDLPPEFVAYRDAQPRNFSNNIYNYMWGPNEFTATGTLKSFDATPQLRRLDGSRTLFLCGEDDEATPPTVAAFARIAKAKFVEVPHAGHALIIDNAPFDLAAIRQWCNAQEAS